MSLQHAHLKWRGENLTTYKMSDGQSYHLLQRNPTSERAARMKAVLFVKIQPPARQAQTDKSFSLATSIYAYTTSTYTNQTLKCSTT